MNGMFAGMYPFVLFAPKILAEALSITMLVANLVIIFMVISFEG